MNDYFENYCKIKEEIALLSPHNVQIVIATKGQNAETLQKFSQKHIEKFGQKPIFGENKVQEFLTKYGKVDAVWHFIGTLQTNKVKYIVDKIDCIQSVSSSKLLCEIQRQATKASKILKIFLEANIANESNKTGADEEEFYAMLQQIKNCENLKFTGLMAMLPVDTPQNNLQFCLQIAAIYDKIKEEYSLCNLSLGMSQDYVQAILCGSNMVRLGRIVFEGNK